MSAFVALMIGTGGLWIAHWQMRVAREKLKADLFDRRFIIFSHHQEMVNQVIFVGGNDFDTGMMTINKAFRYSGESQFLLDEALNDILKDLRDRAAEFLKCQKMVILSSGRAPAELQQRQEEIAEILLTDYKFLAKLMVRSFRRYLQLKDFHN